MAAMRRLTGRCIPPASPRSVTLSNEPAAVTIQVGSSGPTARPGARSGPDAHRRQDGIELRQVRGGRTRHMPRVDDEPVAIDVDDVDHVQLTAVHPEVLRI